MAGIELNVPNDVRKTKKKDLAFFSFREILFMIPAGALMFLSYQGLNKLGLASDTVIALAGLSGSPFLAFAFVKIHGLPLEKWLQSAFIPMFLAPKNRLYKTKNAFREETPKKKKKTIASKQYPMYK